MRHLLLILVLLLPMTAFAQAPQDDDDSALVVADDDDSAPAIPEVAPALPLDGELSGEDVPAAVGELVRSASSGNWSVAFAALLMLLIWVWRLKGPWLAKVPREYLPWVAVAVSVAGHLAGALAAGLDPLSAVMQGLLVGAGAGGAWSLTAPARKKASAPKSE